MLTRTQWVEALVAGLCGTVVGVALAIAFDWRGAETLLAAAVGGTVGFVSYRPTVVAATFADVTRGLAVTLAAALAQAASTWAQRIHRIRTTPARAARAVRRIAVDSVHATVRSVPAIACIAEIAGVFTLSYLLFAIVTLHAIGGDYAGTVVLYVVLLMLGVTVLCLEDFGSNDPRAGKPVRRSVRAALAAANLLNRLTKKEETTEEEKIELFSWRHPTDGSLVRISEVRDLTGEVVAGVAFLLALTLLSFATATLAVIGIVLEAIALLANRPRIAAFSGGAVGALAGALAGPTVGLPPLAALIIGAAACTVTITGAVGAYRAFLAPVPNRA